MKNNMQIDLFPFLVCACSFLGCAGSGAGPVEPVKVIFDNPLHLIVLQAKIAGQGPFRFVLDSGASGTVIDTQLAKRLGLKTGRPTTGRSTAARSRVTAASVRGGVEFGLAPGLAIHVERVIAAPFTQISQIMIGEHFDGILGSEVFFQYVVEVDYARQNLVFHDPSGFKYVSQEGEWEEADKSAVLELAFPNRSRLPYIKSTLVNGDRRLADFLILVDSGGQTMGTASVARRSEWDALITPENKVVDVLGATGLSNDAEGTTHEAFITRMDHFTMGPYTFDRPLVSYSAGGPSMAVMGASLLHRFTVTFDYRRKRLILEPNRHFYDPILADQSGAMLTMAEEGDGSFSLMFVAPGTPAAEAGLRRGDKILAINGTPARRLGLNDLRAMFCRSGTFALEVQRDARLIEAVLKTRPLFRD